MVTRALYSAQLFWLWNSRVRQSHQNRKLLHSHFIQVHISLGYGHEMYINRILVIFFQIPTAVFRGGCSCWRRVWASPPSRTAWAWARETLLQGSGHAGQEQGEGRTHQIKKQRSPCSQGRGQSSILFTPFSTIRLLFLLLCCSRQLPNSKHYCTVATCSFSLHLHEKLASVTSDGSCFADFLPCF